MPLTGFPVRVLLSALSRFLTISRACPPPCPWEAVNEQNGVESSAVRFFSRVYEGEFSLFFPVKTGSCESNFVVLLCVGDRASVDLLQLGVATSWTNAPQLTRPS